MKRNLLYLLLIVSVPVCLFVSAIAQNSAGDATGKDASIEKREGENADAPSERETKPSGKEGTADLNKGGDKRKTDGVKKEARKKTERKKKEVKKQIDKKAEDKKEPLQKAKENISEENIDRESGDSLLLIDHESIKYNRIPGITIKTEEPGQDLVRIPDKKITEKEKEKSKSGIFGPKTDTIARWGLLVFLFVIFIIYKARAKKTRKKGSRIIKR